MGLGAPKIGPAPHPGAARPRVPTAAAALVATSCENEGKRPLRTAPRPVDPASNSAKRRPLARGNGHFSSEAAIGAGLLGPGGELELLGPCEVTPRATPRESVRAKMVQCSSEPTSVLMSGPGIVMVRLGSGHVSQRRPARGADRRPRRATVSQRRPRKWAAGVAGPQETERLPAAHFQRRARR